MNRVPPQRPLHQLYERLVPKLPHVSLAQLPTPLHRQTLGQRELLLKLDGATSERYGGNKVRKLEYLLGQAKRHGCQRVATFGAAGSNHATATAVHAHAIGLRCTTFLSRQRATPWIADNLRRQLACDTDIVFVDGVRAQREAQADAWIQQCGDRVWRVPMGGSSVAGALGYVNAGMELAQQLDSSRLPDRIYVPLGTMGTAVGLAVGLQLADVRIPLHAVRVVHQSIGGAASAPRFFTKITRLLHYLDASIPLLRFDPEYFVVREEFFGDGYAHATDASKAAVSFAHERWGMRLETTYSGKTLAAVLTDSDTPSAPGRPLLWCTYSAALAPAKPSPEQLARLPSPLMHYLK